MYVAISTDLKARVRTTISKMRDNEVAEELPNTGKPIASLANDLLYAIDWREHLPLKEQMPVSWLRKPEGSVTARIKFMHPAVSDKPQTMLLNYRGAGLDFCYRPRGNEGYREAILETTEEYIQSLPEDTQGRSVTLKRIADTKRLLEIDVRWASITKDVMGLLDACRSLNEAVKLVPGIKLYVDSDDVERMERKAERKARPELAKGIDADTLTAAAAAARLANAI
jgi:hypothetical protein